MTLTSKNHELPEEVVSAERIKKKARIRRMRSVRELAARVQFAPDGSRAFLRFSTAQRIEHWVLLVTFTILAVTGLLQRYSRHLLVDLMIRGFGGIEAVRVLHHLCAIIMILQSIYHVQQILVVWLVKRERGGMWPKLDDFRNLVQIVMFNLGLASEKPKFDRFSIDEKIEYWAMLWGTFVMIITGIIMWFPLAVTALFPGDVIPVSRAIHSWEAVLATLAIIVWHMYHVTIKEQNTSIFTGTLTEEEMLHSHPLEHRRIIAAYQYLQKISRRNSVNSETVKNETRHESAHKLGQAD